MRGRLRVVAGTAGGRRLESPASARTRPTAERVREAVFSAVGDAVVGTAVLDLYAGTGAMAVEALSRGAARAVLVERDRREADVARRNLGRAGFVGAGRVVVSDVAAYVRGPIPAEAPFGLVCCDPPYDLADDSVDDVLVRLDAPGWLEPEALVVVERPAGSPLAPPRGWRHRFARTYGDTLVHLLSTGTPDPPTRPPARP